MNIPRPLSILPLKKHHGIATLPLCLIFLSLLTTAMGGEGKITEEKLHYLAGRTDPAKNSAYALVPPAFALKSGMYLEKKTLAAFQKMAGAAKKDGIELLVLSGTRNFLSQKGIWEAKFNGSRKVEGVDLKKKFPDELKRTLEILKWSSMPGTSRHHWGSDFDIAFNRKDADKALTNSAYEKGQGLKTYQWLRKHAAGFGFCQPYLEAPQKRGNNRKNGYNEEKWHWSYKPVSASLLADYRDNISLLSPNGFAGAYHGRDLYRDYVLNVAVECQ